MSEGLVPPSPSDRLRTEGLVTQGPQPGTGRSAGYLVGRTFNLNGSDWSNGCRYQTRHWDSAEMWSSESPCLRVVQHDGGQQVRRHPEELDGALVEEPKR